MSIVYPLNLPSTRQVSSVRMNAINVVGVSQSPFTGKQQVYQYPGQFWQADITLRPMDRAEAEQWISFMLKLQGSYGTFLLGDPNGASPRGSGASSPLVNGAGQTGSSLVTKGWPASTSGVLLAGDYIQLGSGGTARLYKVLDNVTSNALGNATLTIWPALRSSPSDSAAITLINPRSVFRLTSPVAWDIGLAQTYGITFGAREAL